MNQDADEFRTAMPDAPGLEYPQRCRNDSRDLVGAVWPAVLEDPPADGRFQEPESLIAYLTRMARTTAGDKNYDRPTVRQQLLDLIRQGVTYGEIADHLNAPEKTIRRLVRRSTLEAQPCPPS